MKQLLMEICQVAVNDESTKKEFEKLLNAIEAKARPQKSTTEMNQLSNPI